MKKQAKDLLRACAAGDAEALARVRAAVPAAGRDPAQAPRLHDAQSCVAREYGFDSWLELRTEVEWRAVRHTEARILYWLTLVYAGHVFPGYFAARPRTALKLLASAPGLLGGDPYLACAACDPERVARAIAAEAGWVNRTSSLTMPLPVARARPGTAQAGERHPPGNPGFALAIPPLAAVTLSSIAGLEEMRPRARRCVRLLLDAGADPNQAYQHRQFGPLSALYGAAGVNHDPELTRMLLAAGANPNDGESLYHSTETADHTCTRLLLEAGARVEDSNALAHILDREDPEGLRLLLAYTKNPDAPGAGGRALFWAIRRRRSAQAIRLLLEAGADPSARNKEGLSPYAMALRYGLTEAARALEQAGAGEAVSEEDRFVAACAAGDREEARRIQARRPDLPASLSRVQLKQLPELAETGGNSAVETMVELGWPLDVRGGDWGGTALNMAVFHGNVPLVRFLLEHGANWTEGHDFGDNVCGTLSHASCNNNPEHDWVAIAKLLVEHGMPGAEPLEPSADPALAECVRINGKTKRFSEDVTEYLLSVGARF